MANFHDENYDGIVLKIPSWFIPMNDLEETIQLLQSKLQDCNKSMYYSDHTKNLYELDNRSEKLAIVKAQKDASNEYAKRYAEKQEKILSGEIYELEWVKENAYIDRENLHVGDEEFGWDDYFTNKLNIKSDFTRKIKSLVNTFESLRQFGKENCHRLTIDCEFANPELIDLNYSFYCTQQASLGMTYRRLNVKTDWRQVNKNLKYRLHRLVQLDDGCFAINNGGNIETWTRLEGYKKDGMLLVKK